MQKEAILQICRITKGKILPITLRHLSNLVGIYQSMNLDFGLTYPPTVISSGKFTVWKVEEEMGGVPADVNLSVHPVPLNVLVMGERLRRYQGTAYVVCLHAYPQEGVSLS